MDRVSEMSSIGVFRQGCLHQEGQAMSIPHRPEAPLGAGTTVVSRCGAALQVEAWMEDEVELFSYLGEGSDERPPPSFGYSTGKGLSKPVRLLSETPDVYKVHFTPLSFAHSFKPRSIAI